MNHFLIILFTVSILVGCSNMNSAPEQAVSNNQRSLLDNARLAINPKFKNWVLFSNGTYIILDDVNNKDSIRLKGIELMKEFGPVSAGGSAGDFGVVHLNRTEGWTVSGHGYGMYTYVHPSELNVNAPNDLDIGLFGRSKRDKDSKELNILHINNSDD